MILTKETAEITIAIITSIMMKIVTTVDKS